MTPAILQRIVEERFIDVSSINLIIIDECHHATGNHPIGRLADAIVQSASYNNPSHARPLIFGLTASPVQEKTDEIYKLINALEKRLDSTFFNPTEELYLSLEPYEAKAKLFCLEFGNSSHHMSYLILSNKH